jgi:hypothetical protein
VGAPPGRAAIFADCGMGKSFDAARVGAAGLRAHEATVSRPVLIVAPIAVGAQTHRRGAKFGVTVERGPRRSRPTRRSRSRTTSGCTSSSTPKDRSLRRDRPRREQHPEERRRRRPGPDAAQGLLVHPVSALLHGDAGAERRQRAREPRRVPRGHVPRRDAGDVLRPRLGRPGVAAEGSRRRGHVALDGDGGRCSSAARATSAIPMAAGSSRR